ncbi:MAG TPA: fatty acid desaturase [Bryobacteraceae bacterium]|nr:fatty acid desaturase [Bryobacteraceae bacterium]
MLFSGVFDLPWWGVVIVALVLTHITIASVTIYLHRCQAHRALDLHPIASHFFRCWLWLTTGMVTKEWAAIHRKHHAKCETPEDPHSPQQVGINKVLWTGVLLYVKESYNQETMQRYGHGTPDDWIERNVYSRLFKTGLTLMALIDIAMLGIVPGLLVFITQIAWIPFWAAGVINGIGHFWGYRNWEAEDASTNIFPWGILIGGEELHNNHHAFASSAKLSSKWYEFDIGWMYIRMMEMVGLAKVKKIAPTPKFAPPKSAVDLETLQAVLTHRYDVWAKYAKSLKTTYAQEVSKFAGEHPQLWRVRRWLVRDEKKLGAQQRAKLAAVLAKSQALETAYSMRRELAALWDRSTASSEQLLKQLQDWCSRAEASGIAPLREFSLRLRCYAS